MRTDPIQTETVVQDIGSFSESVRAVFHFFPNEAQKMEGYDILFDVYHADPWE
jgi:hypothetical protein